MHAAHDATTAVEEVSTLVESVRPADRLLWRGAARQNQHATASSEHAAQLQDRLARDQNVPPNLELQLARLHQRVDHGNMPVLTLSLIHI